MKAALVGYGRMGHEIERLMRERGHEIVLIADEGNTLSVSALQTSGAQVAVEFTTPAAAFGNVRTCLQAGTAVVCGTTGWLDRWDEAVALCREKDGALFYASNYSIGVNLLFRLNEQLARMMVGFPQYEVSISETHHIHKKDAPSGTALTLRDGIEGRGDVPIESIREGEHAGLHEVVWRSEVDALTLKHESFSRLGLASGAVMAAEFLAGKNGIFSMEDLMGNV